MITLSSESKENEYDKKIKQRMTIVHDLSEEEMKGMDKFLEDFHELANESDIKELLKKTMKYKNSVEKLWKMNEKSIMSHIESILGYTPENVAKVNTYMMYPNYDTHRSCQVSENSTSLFLGKRGADTENKILAHLAHQVVHQPMLPYKLSMSKQEKDKLHGFIKFLTDKEIYSELSGESGLKITTPQENYELMGKMYPYWLGYKFRNCRKLGLEPSEEIKKSIQKDKEYYESLPKESKSRSHYKYYQLDKLDPEKIAEFFRYKKGMSPYEFIQIDFDNRDNVIKKEEREEAIR